MRKLFSIICCVLLIAAMCMPMAYADNVTYSNGYAEDGEISVGYHEYSSFTISLPTFISPESNSYISVISSDMENGMGITVSATNLAADNTITLTNVSDTSKTVKASVYAHYTQIEYDNPVLASFSYDTLTSGNIENVYMNIQVNGRAPQAGDYAGVICYHIDCVPM